MPNLTALKKGVDRYINARIQTPEGAKMVMKLIEDKRTFKVNVTDEILVVSRKDENGKTVYATASGVTQPGFAMTLTTNQLHTDEILSTGNPNDKLSVVEVNNNGELVKKTIKRAQFQKVYGNKSTDYTKDYTKAQEDAGFDLNGRENNPKSNEEQLHNTGAHEETHLLQKEKMKTYNAEKPAFENQKKASEDYQKWNDDPKVEQKK